MDGLAYLLAPIVRGLLGPPLMAVLKWLAGKALPPKWCEILFREY